MNLAGDYRVCQRWFLRRSIHGEARRESEIVYQDIFHSIYTLYCFISITTITDEKDHRQLVQVLLQHLHLLLPCHYGISLGVAQFTSKSLYRNSRSILLVTRSVHRVRPDLKQYTRCVAASYGHRPHGSGTASHHLWLWQLKLPRVTDQ